MKNAFSKTFLDLVKKGKTPGFSELLAMMQLIPEAAFLYSTENKQIMGGNSPLFLLTAYSQPEISGKPLSFLMPEHSESEVLVSLDKTFLVQRLNRKPISAIIHIQPLDTNNHWLLFTLIPSHEGIGNLEDRISNGLGKLINSLKENSENESDIYIENILRFLSRQIEAEISCIYCASPDTPELIKSVSIDSGGVLPSRLPSQELQRLDKTDIWKPGNRVSTELHRICRREALDYLVIAPLGEGGMRIGLLVLGGRLGEINPIWFSLIELVVILISQKMVNEQLSKNTQTEIQHINSIINIRNKGIEFAQEGIILLDTQLKVMELNPQLEWMLGYAEKEVLGSHVENILIGPERLAISLNSATRDKEPVNLGVAHLHRRNGQSFPAKILIFPVLNEDEVEAILIYLSDVSEHEQIQARTQQLEQRALLGDVTAIFAHEVRNPINNISTALQVLCARLQQDNPNREVVNRMQNDCSRLNNLMESVLTFARQKEVNLEPMDLPIYIQRFVDRWRPKLFKENITSFFSIEPDLPSVRGDAKQLDQVFTNLITNAVEAMHHQGGTLSIKLASTTSGGDRRQVKISISDTGPGIPDEVRERLFEPFVSSKQNGTGLGLAITKQIITAHKGSICVDSFPGGTVFTVLLPAFLGD